MFFDDLLDTKVCEFNSRYAEAEGLLLGKFFDHEENRELDLDQDLWDYVIVHELLHFFVPNHGKLWESLMRVHMRDHENLEVRLRVGS